MSDNKQKTGAQERKFEISEKRLSELVQEVSDIERHLKATGDEYDQAIQAVHAKYQQVLGTLLDRSAKIVGILEEVGYEQSTAST